MGNRENLSRSFKRSASAFSDQLFGLALRGARLADRRVASWFS